MNEMKDFADAALPWITMVLAVALVVSTYSRNSGRQKRKKEGPGLLAEFKKAEAGGERKNGYLTAGLCLGLCIGGILSLLGAVSLPYGISFGILFGVTAAVCIKR